MANELANLVEQRKSIESQESEIKIKMMDAMKQNNLSVWAFEKGKVAHQSRISYSEWDMPAIKSKIGEHLFDEIVNIRVGELRNEMQVVHNNLNERVKWITKVRNFDLPKYINRSRIFILPSLYE